MMHRLFLAFQKFNIALVDNAKNLDVVMPIYNLLEYSKYYSRAKGSFWNYYSVKDSKSFNYKTGITGKL